jgi:hypothetical protein
MNTLKLTNNQTQILYYWATEEYFEHSDRRILLELDKITEKNPYEDKKHAPTLCLDYIGDILVQECKSSIEYTKEDPDVQYMTNTYSNILKKLEKCKWETPKNNIEKRFKLLSSLCIELGVLENKMQELADKIDECHHQSDDALTFYEGKVLEVLDELSKEALVQS